MLRLLVLVIATAVMLAASVTANEKGLLIRESPVACVASPPIEVPVCSTYQIWRSIVAGKEHFTVYVTAFLANSTAPRRARSGVKVTPDCFSSICVDPGAPHQQNHHTCTQLRSPMVRSAAAATPTAVQTTQLCELGTAHLLRYETRQKRVYIVNDIYHDAVTGDKLVHPSEIVSVPWIGGYGVILLNRTGGHVAYFNAKQHDAWKQMPGAVASLVEPSMVAAREADYIDTLPLVARISGERATVCFIADNEARFACRPLSIAGEFDLPASTASMAITTSGYLLSSVAIVNRSSAIAIAAACKKLSSGTGCAANAEVPWGFCGSGMIPFSLADVSSSTTTKPMPVMQCTPPPHTNESNVCNSFSVLPADFHDPSAIVATVASVASPKRVFQLFHFAKSTKKWFLLSLESLSLVPLLSRFGTACGADPLQLRWSLDVSAEQASGSCTIKVVAETSWIVYIRNANCKFTAIDVESGKVLWTSTHSMRQAESASEAAVCKERPSGTIGDAPLAPIVLFAGNTRVAFVENASSHIVIYDALNGTFVKSFSYDTRLSPCLMALAANATHYRLVALSSDADDLVHVDFSKTGVVPPASEQPPAAVLNAMTQLITYSVHPPMNWRLWNGFDKWQGVTFESPTTWNLTLTQSASPRLLLLNSYWTTLVSFLSLGAVSVVGNLDAGDLPLGGLRIRDARFFVSEVSVPGCAPASEYALSILGTPQLKVAIRTPSHSPDFACDAKTQTYRVFEIADCRVDTSEFQWQRLFGHARTLVLRSASISGVLPLSGTLLFSPLEHLDLSHNSGVSGVLFALAWPSLTTLRLAGVNLVSPPPLENGDGVQYAMTTHIVPCSEHQIYRLREIDVTGCAGLQGVFALAINDETCTPVNLTLLNVSQTQFVDAMDLRRVHSAGQHHTKQQQQQQQYEQQPNPQRGDLEIGVDATYLVANKITIVCDNPDTPTRLRSVGPGAISSNLLWAPCAKSSFISHTPRDFFGVVAIDATDPKYWLPMKPLCMNVNVSYVTGNYPDVKSGGAGNVALNSMTILLQLYPSLAAADDRTISVRDATPAVVSQATVQGRVNSYDHFVANDTRLDIRCAAFPLHWWLAFTTDEAHSGNNMDSMVFESAILWKHFTKCLNETLRFKLREKVLRPGLFYASLGVVRTVPGVNITYPFLFLNVTTVEKTQNNNTLHRASFTLILDVGTCPSVELLSRSGFCLTETPPTYHRVDFSQAWTNMSLIDLGIAPMQLNCSVPRMQVTVLADGRIFPWQAVQSQMKGCAPEDYSISGRIESCSFFPVSSEEKLHCVGFSATSIRRATFTTGFCNLHWQNVPLCDVRHTASRRVLETENRVALWASAFGSFVSGPARTANFEGCAVDGIDKSKGVAVAGFLRVGECHSLATVFPPPYRNALAAATRATIQQLLQSCALASGCSFNSPDTGFINCDRVASKVRLLALCFAVRGIDVSAAADVLYEVTNQIRANCSRNSDRASAYFRLTRRLFAQSIAAIRVRAQYDAAVDATHWVLCNEPAIQTSMLQNTSANRNFLHNRDEEQIVFSFPMRQCLSGIKVSSTMCLPYIEPDVFPMSYVVFVLAAIRDIVFMVIGIAVFSIGPVRRFWGNFAARFLFNLAPFYPDERDEWMGKFAKRVAPRTITIMDLRDNFKTLMQEVVDLDAAQKASKNGGDDGSPVQSGLSSHPSSSAVFTPNAVAARPSAPSMLSPLMATGGGGGGEDDDDDDSAVGPLRTNKVWIELPAVNRAMSALAQKLKFVSSEPLTSPQPSLSNLESASGADSRSDFGSGRFSPVAGAGDQQQSKSTPNNTESSFSSPASAPGSATFQKRDTKSPPQDDAIQQNSAINFAPPSSPSGFLGGGVGVGVGGAVPSGLFYHGNPLVIENDESIVRRDDFHLFERIVLMKGRYLVKNAGAERVRRAFQVLVLTWHHYGAHDLRFQTRRQRGKEHRALQEFLTAAELEDVVLAYDMVKQRVTPAIWLLTFQFLYCIFYLIICLVQVVQVRRDDTPWHKYQALMFRFMNACTPISLLTNSLLRRFYKEDLRPNFFVWGPFLLILPATITHVIPAIFIFIWVPVLALVFLCVILFGAEFFRRHGREVLLSNMAHVMSTAGAKKGNADYGDDGDGEEGGGGGDGRTPRTGRGESRAQLSSRQSVASRRSKRFQDGGSEAVLNNTTNEGDGGDEGDEEMMLQKQRDEQRDLEAAQPETARSLANTVAWAVYLVFRILFTLAIAVIFQTLFNFAVLFYARDRLDLSYGGIIAYEWDSRTISCPVIVAGDSLANTLQLLSFLF